MKTFVISFLLSKKYILLSTIIIFLMELPALSQSFFPEKCIGTWKGTMYIYQLGKLSDSVDIIFSVNRLDSISWTWKTEYLSPRMPMVKNYILRLKDKKNNMYVTDEGEGIELTDYQIGNKLYSVFETGGTMLTASYELHEKELIFEVTSGTIEEAKHPEITTYSTTSVQRAVLRRDK